MLGALPLERRRRFPTGGRVSRRTLTTEQLRDVLPNGMALTADAASPVRVIAVQMDTVTPSEVSWLWPGRIPFGKLTLLEGDPGVSKSTLTIELAARLSRGEPMPGGDRPEPSDTLFVTYEDGLEDTIAPRLHAAGANLSRVTALQGVAYNGDPERMLRIPDDVPVIAEQVRARGARLVVIDPLGAALSTKTDSYKDADTRSALAPLARVAEETGAAIVIVRHLNKSATAKAIYAGGGSIGIAGAARAVLAVHTDPEDPSRRILAVAKNNLAKFPRSLRYTLEDTGTGPARIQWLGEVDTTAEELNARRAEAAEVHTGELEPEEWLREFLADGPSDRREVLQRGRDAGFSERTLDRARQRLKVETAVHGFGKDKISRWSLPACTESNPAISANPANVAMYTNTGGNGGNGGNGVGRPDLRSLDVAV